MITNIKDFPSYMPNVKKTSIEEKRPRGAITAWEVELDKMTIAWRQEDEFDIPNFCVRFKLIDGDLKHFSGVWKLEETESSGTLVSIEATARLGIPMLEDVIEDVISARIQKNFEHMLESINDQLTRQRYRNIHNRAQSDIRGFAVIGHPYNLEHLIRYFKFFQPDFEAPSEKFLMKAFSLAPAYCANNIDRFTSATGKKTHGHFLMCPIIPAIMVLNPEKVVDKVVEACRVAEQLGVGIVGLGGFTSMASEQFGKALLDQVHVPLTSGNSFTVAMVIAGIEKAAELMGITLSNAKTTIIGGTGDIGQACARILARRVKELTITSRTEKNLLRVQALLQQEGTADIHISGDNDAASKDADIIIAAASSMSTIVDFHSFKPGAVICDVGYPKNISYTDCDRKDIFIFSGGICSIPTEFKSGFDIGMPASNVLYGCFAESILLDLEERYENYSWGRGNITPERVATIRAIGEKHGFTLSPFFWGDQIQSEDQIREIGRAHSQLSR